MAYRWQAAGFLGRLLPLLIVAAAVPSASARKALEHGFVCPERLANDDARILAVRRFVEHYRALVPHSTAAEALAFRDALMRKHRCQSENLIHTFPET